MRPLILIVVFIVTAISLCCAPSAEKNTALDGIKEFHAHFNRHEFSKIYKLAHPDARGKISENDFVEDMKRMRLGQGTATGFEEIATDYHYQNGTSMVKILVLTSYEKGKAHEEFIYHLSGGRAQLASYRFLGPGN